MYTEEEEENNQLKEVVGQSMDDSVPKLEDFFATPMVHYSDSQTDTQDDSSLTHIYDQNHCGAYFAGPAAPFQAFSNNSGSEVDDSVSAVTTHMASTESRTELAYSQCNTGGLSLGVNNNAQICEKAIVAVNSESCKKIADTFGQRTSIYRGVTRYCNRFWRVCIYSCVNLMFCFRYYYTGCYY